MPRKAKSKKDQSPAIDPVTAAEAPNDTSVNKPVEQAEAGRSEPASQTGDEAALEAFRKQREREQAVQEPARAEATPPEKEVITSPEREPIRQPHVEAELARRPKMAPTPAGFMGVARFPPEGIRVNKSLDKRVAAIQFAEDRVPTRFEKDILEAVKELSDRNFSFNTGSRQWERPVPEGMMPGENVIDAVNVAKGLVKGRQEGRSR